MQGFWAQPPPFSVFSLLCSGEACRHYTSQCREPGGVVLGDGGRIIPAVVSQSSSQLPINPKPPLPFTSACVSLLLGHSGCRLTVGIG